MQTDCSDILQQQIAEAFADQTPLRIVAGGSKAACGRRVIGTPLDVAGHRGVIRHEPTELVLTARAGTPIGEIEELLAAHGQMLPFEPPHLGEAATLGGSVACNLSGPRRPYAGAVRDFLLGCRIINGRGEIMHFGGEVMKNVAGYDVTRLMAGAQGTLGVLLDVSLKVLPVAKHELTLVSPCTAEGALQAFNQVAGLPLPLSASAWVDGSLYLRFSGAEAAVVAVTERLPGEPLDSADGFWQKLRERQTPFFSAQSLWRIALPQAAPQPALPGEWLLEWGGAQRWLRSNVPAAQVREAVAELGGHATLIRQEEKGTQAMLHPLSPGMEHIHRRLKQAFDPAGILNPGRLYKDL